MNVSPSVDGEFLEEQALGLLNSQHVAPCLAHISS